MAKVGADDEKVGRVGQVRAEEVAVATFGGWRGGADEDGDYGRVCGCGREGSD